MSNQGYICELCARPGTGASVKGVLVETSPEAALFIVPQVRVESKKYTQGELCPSCAEKIKKALSSLVDKKALAAAAGSGPAAQEGE